VSTRPTPTLYGDRAVYAVSAYAFGVSGWLARLPQVWVEGEVSELKTQPRWSLAYLTLKDLRDGSQLACFMTKTRLESVHPPLAEGERIHAFGRGELYRKRGEFRFEIAALERFGEGLVLRRIEELRQKLGAEGLFAEERKRPLPLLPRVIGLICGSDAAAMRDVVETARTRYPPARFEIVEAAVQGPGAVPQIIAALRRLQDDPRIEVIVLARGGGSFEDLLPFSDERLVRAVSACTTPVVSAIGHEQDTPLVDLVADLRAGTPSLAAKRIVPDYEAEQERLADLLRRGGRGLQVGVERARGRLAAIAQRPAFADPSTWIAVRRGPLALQRQALDGWPGRRLEREAMRLAAARDRLRLLGPGATLERGYAIVQGPDGAVLRDAEDVETGERIGVRLARGRLAATVEEVET